MAVYNRQDEPGVAKLKPEFVLWDHKPTVDTDYISQTTKNQIDEINNKATTDGEPPSKRVKLKGRNKERPVGRKRITAAEKLCPSIVQELECSYAEKCKFNHDVKKFLEGKQPDLEGQCYLYETYGKCPAGITCRFAKSHLTEDFKNMCKPDFSQLKKKADTVSNVLPKELQHSLWKKKYDFSKADGVLEKICPFANTQKKRAQNYLNKKHGGGKQASGGQGSGDGGQSREVGKNGSGGQSGENTQSNISDEKIDSIDDVGKGKIEACLKEKDLGCQDGCSVEENKGTELVTETTSGIQIVDSKLDEPIAMKKKVDFSDKLYLAPLTTVGNLPFRRICKQYGADITCGEMAVCTNLLQGQQSEWALVRRHESEDIFGIQLCGGYPDSMTRCAQLICETMNVDFIDINCGCPIDLIFNKGEGSALMGRLTKFEQIITGMKAVMDVPLTVKMRTGIYNDKNTAHTLVPHLRDWGVAMTTLHGRSRMQRYTKTADWDYINQCAQLASPMPLFGNGDILSYEEANLRREQTGINGIMIARGALIKPWIFTEIKEQRHWDISSTERFEMLKDFVNYGLDNWGSDYQGVENTRRFLLEWLSFLYRYIPVGILESVPQQINERPPFYKGRDEMETLMASPNCGDWIKISEKLLGPVPDGFSFLPKHKANAYK